MGQVCRCCSSPHKAAIDEALVAGRSGEDISRSFQVSEASVQRHRVSHLSPALIAIKQRREERHGIKLVDRLESVVAKVENLIEIAEADKQPAMMLAAAKEFRSGVELIARLTGELDERPQVVVNLASSPELAQIISLLMSALAPYPDARIAAANVLDVEALS